MVMSQDSAETTEKRRMPGLGPLCSWHAEAP